MTFDFDEPIDRRNTHCAKWDAMESVYGVSPDDGIAMWVASMDFRTAPAVNDALMKAVAHGVHGYFAGDTEFRQAVVSWMARRHGWEIAPDWIQVTSGIVSAIGIALQAFTEPGDGVIVFSPVYHAFGRIITANDRTLHELEMGNEGGLYRLDFDALAASLDPRDRVVILCSPHNPGGRVWEADELKAVADFCIAHDLLLISDEIHHDLVFPGNRHRVLATVAPEVSDRLLTMVSASKTFNLAGTMTGCAVIENDTLRRRYAATQAAAGISPNKFGMIATEHAYGSGETWLMALLPYLAENARIFDEGLNAIPGLHSMALQGTYLSWVDFSGTGMPGAEIIERVQNRARIVANHGSTFGKGGENFMRFNIATDRARVKEAVTRLQEAFSDLQ